MNLRGELRGLLARCGRGLSECDALDTRLLAAADVMEKQRGEELERQGKAIRGEGNPHRLRAAEEMYLASLVERARARRLARHLRNKQTDRQEQQRLQGEALIASPRRR